MSQSNDNRTITSTAVEKVSTDTYNANLPSQTQNTNSIQMRILPDGKKMISRVMNLAEAGVSFEDVQSENYGQLKDKRELLRRKEEFEQDLDKKKRENEPEVEHQRALKELPTNLVSWISIRGRLFLRERV